MISFAWLTSDTGCPHTNPLTTIRNPIFCLQRCRFPTTTPFCPVDCRVATCSGPSTPSTSCLLGNSYTYLFPAVHMRTLQLICRGTTSWCPARRKRSDSSIVSACGSWREGKLLYSILRTPQSSSTCAWSLLLTDCRCLARTRWAA